MNIMVIDDDPEDALIFCEVLGSIAPHLKCIVSNSWQTAKEILDELDPPQYIFLDAYMYPAGGKECMALLNKMEKLSETMIIVHSGALRPSQVDEFYLLGADQIMMKSSNHESLRTSLKEILAIGA
jgi:response regulator of citrate/malate metabolism